MKSLFIFLIASFLSATSLANNFDDFSKILQSHVITTNLKNGGIQTSFNYSEALKNKSTQELISSQKKKLSEVNVETLKTKNEALSFWINSYNFFMIATILEQGFKNGKLKINSVKDLGSFFSPYKIFKKNIHNVGGKNLSLDHIEKTILLGEDYKKKGWKDARIHFAVNCASVGCPPLLDTIYAAKTLNQTLDNNVKKAFKTPRHLMVAGKTLKLTSLLKWYKKDFEESAGSIKGFIKKFVDPETSKNIEATSKISHIDYDWNLNTAKNFK